MTFLRCGDRLPFFVMKKKIAIAYTRVSSNEQIDNTSLASQKKVCTEFVEEKDAVMSKVFCEKGESAKFADRPILNEMIEYCKQNQGKIDILVVYKVDRLARNMIDFYKLIEIFAKMDITFASATEPIDTTPIGKAMQGMLAVFAEFDNSIKADRTKEALKSIIENEKRYPHKAPFGYLNYEKENGKKDIKPDPELAPLVIEAFERYANGTHTLREIARIFTSRDIKGPRGGDIDEKFVRKMLENEFYIGEKYKYGKEKKHVVFNHEHLFSKELFNKVQVTLMQRSNNADQPRAIISDSFPMRQFIRCGDCEQCMTGYNATGRGGKKFAYYKCYNKECENGTSYPREAVHGGFIDYLTLFIPTKEAADLFKTAFVDEWDRLQHDSQESITHLEKTLKKLNADKEKISTMVKEGFYTIEEGKEDMERLRNKLLVTEVALNDARTDHVEAELVLDEGLRLFRNIPEFWIRADVEGKKKLQFHLFPEGVIYEDESFSNRGMSLCIEVIKGFETNNYRMG